MSFVSQGRSSFSTSSIFPLTPGNRCAAESPPAGLFDTMLQLIYTGNERQAWELFEISWPEGCAVSREQYRADVEDELSRSRFYPMMGAWNKEKS